MYIFQKKLGIGDYKVEKCMGFWVKKIIYVLSLKNLEKKFNKKIST
jgi:hypothetical protein